MHNYHPSTLESCKNYWKIGYDWKQSCNWDTFIINKDLIEKDNDTNKSYAEDTTISSFTSNGNS